MKVGLTWRERLGDPACPYMERWVLNAGRFGSLRLHHWFRSDDKRAKHDHPADFVTVVLNGGYTDLGMCVRCAVCNYPRPGCPHCGGSGEIRERMTRGSIARRRAEHKHTVAVDPGGCWTLLFFWPDRRRWGFWVPRTKPFVSPLTPFPHFKFKKANKYFLEHGHHPCDQP